MRVKDKGMENASEFIYDELTSNDRSNMMYRPTNEKYLDITNRRKMLTKKMDR